MSAASEATNQEAIRHKAVVTLGHALFNDETLSNPTGQSCASCHAQAAGWTFPNSRVNEQSGLVPGANTDRLSRRRPPSLGYLALAPATAPVYSEAIGTYAGGYFYDGRAASLDDQVAGPLLGSDEMNNTREGVVRAVAEGPHAALFERAFGISCDRLTVDEAFDKIKTAIVAFECSPTFAPFSSKFDAYLRGTAALTPIELAGLQLFTGSRTGRPGGAAVKSAGCATCHTLDEVNEQHLFSSSSFHNIGVPGNPAASYHRQTNAVANPSRLNIARDTFIDFGLGDVLYRRLSLPPGNVGSGSDGRGDFLRINGKFKTPTLRNVDARPTPDFVKSYGHNGYFKSLEQLVHFYNTRNLTTARGEVINFTERDPYARLQGQPIWPPPEIADPTTLENPTGIRGLLGNLGLTSTDEANLVAFLRTLSDQRPASQQSTEDIQQDE
ncbi:MAG: hypothetical protein KDA92_09055 [Planctomycetales bacterium]|nr:hypothetical protein [Planctomycetales bacterium]MCA9166058.1 hypothetical protein [Planctomycetales bacterium]